jgi:hypothetical protein
MFQLRITSGISLLLETGSILMVLGQIGQRLLGIGSLLEKTEPLRWISGP